MKTLLPRSVLSSLNCRAAQISDGMSQKRSFINIQSKTLLPRSVLSSLNCRRAEISDGVSEKEDGDADGGEDDGHPADPQRLARALLGAEEPPAVQAGRRAEPVKVDPSSI